MRRSVIFLLIMMLILFSLVGDSSDSEISKALFRDEGILVPKLTSSLLPPKPVRNLGLLVELDGTVRFGDIGTNNYRWSFSSGPNICSSYQVNPDIDYVDCGDDWQLYAHSKRYGKEKLNISPEEFINKTPLLSQNGEVTVGLKRTTVFLLDFETGKHLGTFKPDVPPSPPRTPAAEENALLLVKDIESAQSVVYITRTEYVVQHYLPNSTTEVLWNVAVANINAEVRCLGSRSSLGGISAGADAGTSDIGFSCGTEISVLLRVSDGSLPRPLPDQNLLNNRSPFDPTHKGGNPLAIYDPNPKLEAKNLKENTSAGTTMSSGLATKSHMLPVVAAILSIVGTVLYNYLAFRKWSTLNKSVEEFKSEAGVRKKKKGKRSMNNKSNSNDERRQKYLSMENTTRDNNERNFVMTFSDVVDGPVDGRNIGKLLVSNKEIAKGSNGTVVLEGLYDGRSVAVKRLVKTHHDVAVKEIQNLIASDQHPNIVRWFGVEHDQDFVYLALQRCTCSLNDFIYVNSESFQSGLLSEEVGSSLLLESTVMLQSMLDQNRSIELWKPNGHPSTQLLKLMRDMVSGLAHLHELGIIHRDLKPQNVLIINDKNFCAKLSDMGISRRLVGDNTSLTHHTTGHGSSGWRAPEQLLERRQTRAVDLFSLGCVLFFCVTGGKHPFGDNIERDVNILNDRKDLFLVENIPEAVDLFSLLLDPNPDKRPKAQEVLNHPFFWTHEKRLSFLQDISDRVELEDRENQSDLLDSLEGVGTVALDGKWDEKLEAAFINNIGRYRRYKYDSIRDLLRVIRNKSHHYRELPQEIKELLGSHPEGFENYFSFRFPKLLIEVYNATYSYCREEEFFRKYIQTSII